MNVSLTPELQQFVQKKVETGAYPTAGEVIRDALRLLQEHDEVREFRLKRLRKEIHIGLDQLDRSESVAFDDSSLPGLFDDIKARGRKRLAAEKNGGQ